MRRADELVLHVGMGKTGTSTVQAFLRDRRDDLARAGVLLPQAAGRARHAKVGLFIQDDAALTASPEWPRIRAEVPQRFRTRFHRRLLDEVDGSGAPRVLLTDEVLFMQPAEPLVRLRALTDELAARTRLVVYLRRQEDHLVSRYQQGVKIGWVQRLDEWAAEDMSGLYDYAARLRLHRRVLDPATLVVRRYDPARFVGGSLEADFLHACDIDLPAPTAAVATSRARNLSLDAVAVEFLRLLNLHLVATRGAVPGQVDHRDLVARLAPAATGPTLTLPSGRLERWREQWASVNAAVAREHFPAEGDELFGSGAPTRPVVTEQTIDPARIDELAELGGLDDDVRIAVRRLAEQEIRR